MKRLANRGFTLIELMIVVAIIALLAAIAIPNVMRSRATANEAAAIGNMRALISSLEMFRAANNDYPADAWTAMSGANPPYNPSPFGLVTSVDGSGTTVVQGYIYDYTRASATAYTLVAWAGTYGATGTGSRSFFTNEGAVIRHCQMTAGTSRAVVGSNTIDDVAANCT